MSLILFTETILRTEEIFAIIIVVQKLVLLAEGGHRFCNQVRCDLVLSEHSLSFQFVSE